MSRPRISNSHFAILIAAARRKDRRVVATDDLRADVADSVLAKLVAESLIEPIAENECPIDAVAAPGERTTDYRIARKGLQAVGVDPDVDVATVLAEREGLEAELAQIVRGLSWRALRIAVAQTRLLKRV